MTPLPESQSTNIWHYKPWWCQPWSIALTGIGLISGSWFAFRAVWITALVGIPVLLWMVVFLLIYPRQMRSLLSGEQPK